MSTRRIGAVVFILTTMLLLAASARAEGPNLGQPISQADLAPWDLTIMPDGTGLPPGSGTPMRPVEQTSTCFSLIPSAPAVARAMRCAARMPGRPVQALALPLFRTMARTCVERRCTVDTRTGAAFTLFVVNVAAPTAARCEKIIVRSGLRRLLPG